VYVIRWNYRLRERVTKKSDIIDILHESRKISKRVIQEFISGSLSISEEQIVSSKEVALQRAAIKLEGKDKLQEDYFLRLLKANKEWEPRKGVEYKELYQVDLATYLEKRDKEFIDFKQNLYSAYGERVKIFKK